MYPMLWIYFLQSRHGHDSDFDGMFKVFKEYISFKCDGIVSHILDPRYLRLSKPWFTVFTFGIINCDLFLKLFWSACVKGKRSFKSSGEIPQCTLYISIARRLRFLWCIETDSSLSKRFSKDEFWSLCITWRHLSCIIFYYFFCDYDITKSKDNNWTETWRTHSLITIFW